MRHTHMIWRRSRHTPAGGTQPRHRHRPSRRRTRCPTRPGSRPRPGLDDLMQGFRLNGYLHSQDLYNLTQWQ